MAIPTYVQHKTNFVNGGTTVTVTLDAAPTNGNLVVCYGVHGTGSANSLDGAGAAEGFNQRFAGNSSEQNVMVGARYALGDDGSYVFSWTTANECVFVVGEYSGADPTLATALHKEHYQVQTTTAIDITNQVITTVADCLLVMICSRDTTAAETVTFTGDATEVERWDVNLSSTFLGNAGMDAGAASAATYNETATYSAANRRNAAALIAIRPPAAAGGDDLATKLFTIPELSSAPGMYSISGG